MAYKPDSTLCSISNLTAKGITSLTNFPDYYALTSGAASGAYWYTSYDSTFSKPYSRTENGASGGAKNYAPVSYSKGSSYCNLTNSSIGAIGKCNAWDQYSNRSGAICCPNNAGFKSCKVTIHSTTPSNGSLQSPQFKGGASF